MSNAFTDLMVARKIERLKAELATEYVSLAGTTEDNIPVLRTVGDGRTAVWEFIANGGSGYIWHLMQGTSSTSGDWIWGVGLDGGFGNGMLIRNKAKGIGQKVEQVATISSTTAYGFYLTQSSTAPGVFLETRPEGMAPLLSLSSFQTDQNVKMLTLNAAQGAAGDVNGYSGLLSWYKNADFVGGTLNVRHDNGVPAAARRHIKLTGANGMTWHSPSGTDNQWWPFRITTGGSNFNIQTAGLSGTPDSATFTTVIGIKNAQLGFFGVTPASRPAAISSPAADTAALKTAVDAIRAALTTLGLTS